MHYSASNRALLLHPRTSLWWPHPSTQHPHPPSKRPPSKVANIILTRLGLPPSRGPFLSVLFWRRRQHLTPKVSPTQWPFWGPMVLGGGHGACDVAILRAGWGECQYFMGSGPCIHSTRVTPPISRGVGRISIDQNLNFSKNFQRIPPESRKHFLRRLIKQKVQKIAHWSLWPPAPRDSTVMQMGNVTLASQGKNA